MEKQIVSIQEELRKGDYHWEGDNDLIKESNKHKLLLESIDELKEQLPLLKEKIKNARVCGPDCRLKHDDLNINLDILTPVSSLEKFYVINFWYCTSKNKFIFSSFLYRLNYYAL
ncbi:unnamed protein product [Diatraea saccharalis]|uniref:Uncharacterized protein n=1 Tax=Diatraea saccharalis TaxID=40085 RepID=A0A9P0C995_9NEOP|nr:unnamed protein product [Diatraea saccharalis]